MSRNKIDFINDLLSSEKISVDEKIKVLELTKGELKGFGEESAEIKKKLDEIEIKVSKLDGTYTGTISIHTEEPLSESLENLRGGQEEDRQFSLKQEYINPFAEDGITRFLEAYNENLILKTTCHEIDDEDGFQMLLNQCGMNEYLFETHLNCIKREFTTLANAFKINKKMYSLIKGYIYGTTTWSTDKIDMSWSSPDLLNWSKLNPGTVPNPGLNFIEKNEKEGYILPKPFVSSLTKKNIVSFSDFVLLFKSVFHINSNNPLNRLIKQTCAERKFNDWCDVEINASRFGDNIHLFTDVDKLIQAFEKLMNVIKSINVEYKIASRPQVRIEFFEDRDEILLLIHHINSSYKKSLMSTLIRPFGLSMRPIIENQINGLCDFELKADFGNNEFAHINLWDHREIKVLEKLNHFIGIEYILKFKR